MSSAPRLPPSTKNCTPTTPTLSDALADTLTEPDTVEPPEGAVTDTAGGVVSGGGESVVVVTVVDRAELLPAASNALTAYVYAVPLARPVSW